MVLDMFNSLYCEHFQNVVQKRMLLGTIRKQRVIMTKFQLNAMTTKQEKRSSACVSHGTVLLNIAERYVYRKSALKDASNKGNI